MKDLNSILQNMNMNGLIDKMESLQKTHITVGSITFDKSELKRAEPIKHNDMNCTKITWKEGDDDMDKEEAENILNMRGNDVKTPKTPKTPKEPKNKVIIPKAISKTIGGDLYITALGLQKSPELQNLKVDTSNKTDYPNMGMMYKVVDVNAEREK